MKKYLWLLVLIPVMLLCACEGNGGGDVKFRGLFGGNKNIVGDDITSDDITEFYYT